MATATQTRKTAKQLNGFEDFVEAQLAEWKVPGLALAIVRDGEVVLARGFGRRDVEADQEVTTQTLFPLASVTKAFTTTSMATLVDEGKLDWDTPVKTYLPEFALYDPVATERMTPRDLVTHRSGLPRHDLMWYHSSFSRDEIFARLRYLQPSKDFRTVWQYSNLMYMAAGYLVGQLAHSTWEDVVQQRIFDRLGMVSSNFSIRVSQHAPDCSRPYRREKDKVERIPYYEDQDAIGPAGAIVSNVADMSQWLLLQLARGRRGDEQIVSTAQMLELHTPQMVLQQPSKYPETPYTSYALGWLVQPYHGHSVIQHSGGIDGFSTLCSFLPQDNIGVVALSNLNGNPLPYVVTNNVFDRLLGLDQIPWSARFKEDFDEFEAASERGKEQRETSRVPGTTPSHPLEDYAGEYEHPGYGVVTIERDGDGLKATYNGMTPALNHHHYDIFDAVYEPWGRTLLARFTTGADGDIESVAVNLEPTVEDIVFRRMPPREMTTKEFLERFTGVYDLMGRPLTVSMKGEHALTVSIPGQPDFELEPRHGTEFRLKGLSGSSVAFRADESGAITEAVVVQPYGVFTARRR